MSESEVAAVVQYEIQQAQGYDQDVLAAKRAKALDYYYGKMTAPAEGRSSIVSTDLADAVHSVLAQIQPILKTTMLEFKPDGQDDEQQAQTESDFVRDAIETADGWRTVFESIHDALLVGNGWIKISVDTSSSVTTEQYPPSLPDEAIFFVSQPTARDQVVKVTSSATATRVKRTTTTRRLLFDALPPEDMLFSEGHGLASIQEQRFVGQRKLYTVSQLRALKISEEVIATCPDADAEYWTAVEARQGIYQNDDGIAAQNAERLKLVYCCYIRLSMADNDTSELRYVWLSGSNVLKNEPADYNPYITGSAIPMPHRVQGSGLYELLAAIQEGKTHILRNYMDNLEVMNGSRIGAVEGQVNMSDLTNGRINGVIRMRSPDAIVPIPSNDIGQQAMSGLGYLDQVRVQRIGASLDMNETQAQLMSSSATAAAGTLGQVEKMAGWYATNLVETMLKPAFLAVHRLLRGELAGPVNAKMRGKWIDSDSSQWPERTTLAVNMGMTTAEKTQQIRALTGVIQQQATIMQMGGSGVLVDNSKIYNAMTDWLRANDLPQPEQYLVDPDSEESKQVQQQNAQSQQQQKQEMDAMQRQMIQMQHDFELEKQRREIQYKVWSDKLDAETEEAKLVSSSVIEIKKLGAASNDKPRVRTGGSYSE